MSLGRFFSLPAAIPLVFFVGCSPQLEGHSDIVFPMRVVARQQMHAAIKEAISTFGAGVVERNMTNTEGEFEYKSTTGDLLKVRYKDTTEDEKGDVIIHVWTSPKDPGGMYGKFVNELDKQAALRRNKDQDGK